ncbi:MAG: hypothetical protein ABI411_05785 [Tahibacter sp.]
MSTHKPLFIFALFGLAASSATQADVLVGNYGFVGAPKPALVFAPTATGDMPPTRTLGGAANAIVSATGFTYEPVEDVVYVADFYGQAVRVFPIGARGDVPARRTLTSPYIGQPRAVIIDRAHQEMLVLGSGCCVFTYARDADGASAPFTRFLQWGGSSGSLTQLNNPGSITLLEGSDEIALSDYSSATPAVPHVLVFARSAAGNTAPVRVIEGPATQLGSYARSVVFEPSSQRLFVLANDAATGGVSRARIAVFDAGASGNTAPLRTIEGSLTGMDLQGSEYLGGMGLDPINQRLLVSINAGADSRVLAFGYGDSGNVPPALRLAGAQTQLSSPGVPLGVPDRILRSSFDP